MSILCSEIRKCEERIDKTKNREYNKKLKRIKQWMKEVKQKYGIPLCHECNNKYKYVCFWRISRDILCTFECECGSQVKIAKKSSFFGKVWGRWQGRSYIKSDNDMRHTIRGKEYTFEVDEIIDA